MKQSKDVTLGSGELCDHFSLFFNQFFFFTFYRINDSLIIVGWSLCWMCVVKSTDFILTQRITLNNIMRRIFWFFLFFCLVQLRKLFRFWHWEDRWPDRNVKKLMSFSVNKMGFESAGKWVEFVSTLYPFVCSVFCERPAAAPSNISHSAERIETI